SEPMRVYSMDYILFTNSKMKNETVEKIIDTMAKNKPDLVAVAPAMNDFSLDTMYRKHTMTYHPGALKYFQDHKIEAKAYYSEPDPSVLSERLMLNIKAQV